MSVQPSHPKPHLAGHVRACLVGDQMIFLDLLRSKYIGICGPQLHALSEALFGEAPADRPEASRSNPLLIDAWIRRLAKQRLLSDAPMPGMRRQPRLPEPVESLDTDDGNRGGPDWPQLLRLWHSTWVTSAWLRRRSLADIVDRVVAFRSRHSNRDRTLDTDALRAGVGTYMRLRPLALTAHDRCLNDSLALVHFLACQGLFPQWVIGVRAHPFSAHSWVQSAGVVINDQPERVRCYQPILIV